MQQLVPQQKKPYAPPPMSRIEKAFSRMFRNDALSEQNGRCAYCRSALPRDEATADHRIPRVSGGATTRKNIKAACEDCNKAKGWMSEAAFLKRIKNPQHGDDIRIWMAWARRRIALATERACTRIMRMTE